LVLLLLLMPFAEIRRHLATSILCRSRGHRPIHMDGAIVGRHGPAAATAAAAAAAAAAGRGRRGWSSLCCAALTVRAPSPSINRSLEASSTATNSEARPPQAPPRAQSCRQLFFLLFFSRIEAWGWGDLSIARAAAREEGGRGGKAAAVAAAAVVVVAAAAAANTHGQEARVQRRGGRRPFERKKCSSLALHRRAEEAVHAFALW